MLYYIIYKLFIYIIYDYNYSIIQGYMFLNIMLGFHAEPSPLQSFQIRQLSNHYNEYLHLWIFH